MRQSGVETPFGCAQDVYEGVGVVKGHICCGEARLVFSFPRIFSLADQGSFSRILRWFAPPAIYSVSTGTMIHCELPRTGSEGGKALNQADGDGTAFTSPEPELPCMEAGSADFCCSNTRHRQYNFTASFLATATAATLRPRRKARR